MARAAPYEPSLREQIAYEYAMADMMRTRGCPELAAQHEASARALTRTPPTPGREYLSVSLLEEFHERMLRLVTRWRNR